MQLYDSRGKRLYLTADERHAFIAAAVIADRPVQTLCTVLHDTSCQISEVLALTPEHIDLSGRAVMFESLNGWDKFLSLLMSLKPECLRKTTRSYKKLLRMKSMQYVQKEP
jgi:hypothetical protein